MASGLSEPKIPLGGAHASQTSIDLLEQPSETLCVKYHCLAEAVPV